LVETPVGRSADELVAGEEVSGQEVLEKLVALPVSTWRYAWEKPTIRHLGPMAQDFAHSFRLGEGEETINAVDANGVVTVAIQALYRRVRALEDELAALKAKLSKLEASGMSAD
jgi:hypothetical protein